MDFDKFLKGFKESFNSQVSMFPDLLKDKIVKVIKKCGKDALAWKLSGGVGGRHHNSQAKNQYPVHSGSRSE